MDGIDPLNDGTLQHGRFPPVVERRAAVVREGNAGHHKPDGRCQRDDDHLLSRAPLLADGAAETLL